MSLFALGLNHKSAPVNIREQIVFAPDAVTAALQHLRAHTTAREAAILSTCNRTELYVRMDDRAPEMLGEWLARYHRLDPEWLRDYLYLHEGAGAVRHLMRVSAGLDSLVLGEPQILGQAKIAYQGAIDAGTMGRVLDRLFQHAFSVAKQVRTDTGIGANPVSVAFAAVTLARQIFDDFQNRTALLIGAGETIELVARHLREQGLKNLIVANRNLERARQLVELEGGEAIPLSEIPTRLPEADVLVASTASPLPILGKGTVERAVRKRRHRPMFMLDLAVPRDIEPEAGNLDDVYLYTVDDLREVIAENRRSREEAAHQAEEIVQRQVDQFLSWRRAQQAVASICDFRERGHAHARELLQRANRRLRCGEPPERVLAWLSHTLTNRLLHAPTVGLREAAEAGDRERIELARTLLQIENANEDTRESVDKEQTGTTQGAARGDQRSTG
ncbi:glutamyl-tRNA reductase [Alkalilimnicola ehrlichii MLHE-1]|uniref:Glutamyl-tRNA reductase n=1 Tax=Alkalilimnicola ehrlichii (strain ATCC BAA-1101 / DSM 17681 / MLHE-1) TaxID=187272 RepID=HEM1_ALKEH|nr:glutamyl-tRNA reductase [Alkalilimnicola ehrlichii]Q0AC03.1 RecName: Full=Glutamyl-tRNA reductase; Short=GluTR [Alkalilimnicola ehrlichii MLHE-1]ABI55634.1 glutamyl-tRNA reductase [Alkalilimnicola ehrlichii MLHE-1]